MEETPKSNYQPNRKERRGIEAIIRKQTKRLRKQAAKVATKGTP